MDENTENKDENPDFGRGLYVCEKPGHEFIGAGSAGSVIGLVGTQVFAMLFLIPVLGFFVLQNLIGAPLWTAIVFASVSLVIVIAVGIVFLIRINKGNRKQSPGTYLKSESDSRYRVRVVIPKKRQGALLARWAQLATQGGVGDDDMVTEDELEMIEGGFEPIVSRPWFGIRRSRGYWWTFVLMSILAGAFFLFGLSFIFGTWKSLFQSVGFLGYAGMGLVMICGIVSAEMLWPVYLRLVPGQLDIFRYGFLGLGDPQVERFDLRQVGVCVDFGGYIVSLEPVRPVGEPLPALVQAKRWPNGQAFPEGFKPMYFIMTAMPNRRVFAQRLVQAARTDEPTPPVSMERLGE